jgi:hypothetical protein
MTRWLFRNVGGIESPRSPPPAPKPARDLNARELADIVEQGVFRGVMKALFVYALITFLIWLIVVVFSNRA